MKDLKPIISQFDITGTVNEVKPLGNGLINDTYKVTTVEDDAPDYVLQRISNVLSWFSSCRSTSLGLLP